MKRSVILGGIVVVIWAVVFINNILKYAGGHKQEDAVDAPEIQKVQIKPQLSADELKFGEIPYRSQWDGSYLEVERYLKKAAHDPGSIDIDSCSQVYKSEEGWVVVCDFRGKNAFGALVRNSKRFTIFHGQVIKVAD